ncbi:MAG TPA: DinB family protein [Mycobacteriales bacterium]|nr:DinB family protein [Mycobacteriales bacterium]
MDLTGPDPITRDVLATFDDARSRLFDRLAGLTDAEYRWEPVGGSLSIRPDGAGVFRGGELFPRSAPGVPDPVTTIAWRIWHIGSACLRGYVIHFFDDVPDLGDRHAWPGTAADGIAALAEDCERFVSRISALGDKRLLAPIGRGPGGWSGETYLKLVLHALDEIAHHGGEIGLLRDLYLRASDPGAGEPAPGVMKN